jgi:hypothetical protein
MDADVELWLVTPELNSSPNKKAAAKMTTRTKPHSIDNLTFKNGIWLPLIYVDSLPLSYHLEPHGRVQRAI